MVHAFIQDHQENQTCRRPIKVCRNLWKKGMQFWEKVIWSDETQVELFGRNPATSVWRKNGTAFKKHNTVHTIKFGGGSIMIWGRFSSKGTGELQVIHGRMNSSMYGEILEKNLHESATSSGHARNFVLQHDNDPKHTAKRTKEWFENNGIGTLNWPSSSPDVNPNESLWNTLKIKVHMRHPQNIKQLEELCQEEWGKVKLDQCGKLEPTIENDLKQRNKTEATQQNIKLTCPILLHGLILNFEKKSEFLIFLPHKTKTTLRYITYQISGKWRT